MGDSRIIWKFTLDVEAMGPGDDQLSLRVPAGAEILDVQMQFDRPQMWMRVDPYAPVETRRFQIAVTGGPVAAGSTYLGTFQHLGGGLVFHVFEL